MVMPNYCLCDICGEKVDMTSRLYIVTHQVMAGAFNDESVNQGDTVDLCPFHMSLMVKWLLSTQTMNPAPDRNSGLKFMRQITLLKENTKK